MTRKTWILLKRGLSVDPKHRARMGIAIWCFVHILDRADWETGIVYDWRDEDEAKAMSMSENTLRDWRQKLDKLGYIKCRQTQHGLEITIMKWVNPRSYSGKVLNTPTGGDEQEFQGDENTSPWENEGDAQGDTQGPTKDGTLHIDHESQIMDEEKERLLKSFLRAAAQIWPIDAAQGKKVIKRLSSPDIKISQSDHTVTVSGLGMEAPIYQDRYARYFERQFIGIFNDEIAVKFNE